MPIIPLTGREGTYRRRGEGYFGRIARWNAIERDRDGFAVGCCRVVIHMGRGSEPELRNGRDPEVYLRKKYSLDLRLRAELVLVDTSA